MNQCPCVHASRKVIHAHISDYLNNAYSIHRGNGGTSLIELPVIMKYLSLGKQLLNTFMEETEAQLRRTYYRIIDNDITVKFFVCLLKCLDNRRCLPYQELNEIS